jgi:hypothetical protein
MRLWEAIVRGAEKRPQCTGSIWEGIKGFGGSEFAVQKRCAQGAALEGLGCEPGARFAVQGRYVPRWALELNIPGCFVCGHPAMAKDGVAWCDWSMWTMLAHMNDAHNLTRPAIAVLTYYHERKVLGADAADDKRFNETFPNTKNEDYIKVQLCAEAKK